MEVCCFDKTGTLTTDSFQLVGCTKLNISPRVTSKLHHKSSTESKAADSAFVVAGCHSLIQLEGKLIGDPLEKCPLQAMGYNFSHHTAAPKDAQPTRSTVYPQIRIGHRFAFSFALKRMSCIVTVTKTKGATPLVRLVCKGAAETIGQRLKSIPSNYNEVHSYFSKQGFRVLALSWKPLSGAGADRSAPANKLSNRQYLKPLKRNFIGIGFKFCWLFGLCVSA